MADEKKNTGLEEPIVSEAPSPENPGGPPVPPVPEQEAEQGTIPGMEEKPDPSQTVIDLAAARKAAKEKPAAEAAPRPRARPQRARPCRSPPFPANRRAPGKRNRLYILT